MKELILKNKWLGFVALLLYALISATIVTKYTKSIVQQYTPMVVQEVNDFLPITLENGEITAPVNTVISKNYGDENSKINVVLDTTKNEFNATELNEYGLYISKKFVYGVGAKKTEIQSLKNFPNGTLNEEVLNASADAFLQSVKKYLFPMFVAVSLIISALAVLIYTILTHWLMAIVFKVRFAHTLRLNTLTYAAVSII